MKMSFYNALFYPDFKRCTFITARGKTRKDAVSSENGGTKIIQLSIVTMLYHPWGRPLSDLHSNCESAKDFV